MSQTAVISTTIGVVTGLKKVANNTWVVTVSYPGGFFVYTDIDTVAVGNCSKVSIGDVIGYRNVVVPTINIGQQSIMYMGDNTSIYTDGRLINATDVRWSRAGIFKKENLTNDSFTFDAANGKITSTEVQTQIEWFLILYTPKT